MLRDQSEIELLSVATTSWDDGFPCLKEQFARLNDCWIICEPCAGVGGHVSENVAITTDDIRHACKKHQRHSKVATFDPRIAGVKGNARVWTATARCGSKIFKGEFIFEITIFRGTEHGECAE
jgi:hypothetical protein